MVVARDTFLSDEVFGIDRFVEIGLPAAEEALAPLKEGPSEIPSLDVLIGLPSKRPGLPERLGERVKQRFEEALHKRFRLGVVDAFQNGHAAGLIALQEGWRRILGGTATICLVGGIESYLEPETLEWLDDNDQLNSESNSWGFVPGEAAGFCLLCSINTARRYELLVLGTLLAATTSRERHVLNTDSVCLGEGLSEAVKNALQFLAPSTKIDCTICDMNGEPYRAEEFGYTIVRMGERFVDPTNFMTPADCWGDVGAASGPLFVILAVIAELKGYSGGPHTLVFTSSESGERTAAVIQAVNFSEGS
jgi:3-oxoacyl-[acyl-carrier-protein] synthase-1